MKLTRRQLRKLINETIFAGGPTVDSPDKSVGVTVDMGRQNPPIYRPQSDRDEEIRRTADPRIVDLLDSDSEADKQMARTLASSIDGKPEAYETLTPEEREAQGLFDEFYPEDPFDEPHDMSGDMERSYAPEIQQIRNAMKKRIEDAMDKGASSFDDLYSAAYTTPGYDNLRRHLMNLPLNQRRNAKGVYGDKPEDELMNMPGQLVDMYQKHDSDHY
tara:strand:+ start:5555 stop:6205 length:651 start_codon:yes stop_codon:yes gene_type:complete